ncbi:MAG: DUF2202 domain-containing protein [Chloroflexi bacterium]|jgi:hypothetical protein|nr:DUF2202 domain-containing protein [Chloroflexota bacterium]HOE34803.1 DUF2202 domain-containing protein [Anaerolineaceae bacterium]HQL27402.1 DUF2202 domain-containing protein [Anaerolineaceae bacterium]
MKTITKILLLSLAVGLAAAGLSAIFNTASAQTAAPEDLSEAERTTLLHMAAEEKLAHDVYIALYEKWDLPLFQRIARSETNHFDRMFQLLGVYGISSNLDQLEAGEFGDPVFDQLYDDLVSRGLESEEEALKVGAYIEELDVLDLEKAIDESTHADIQRAYRRLLQGSSMHLGAFVRAWESQTNQVYQPQVMTPEQLEDYQRVRMPMRGCRGWR